MELEDTLGDTNQKRNSNDRLLRRPKKFVPYEPPVRQENVRIIKVDSDGNVVTDVVMDAYEYKRLGHKKI
jgi:hypothetical protein